MQQKIVLFPRRICETLSGNLAYTVGRLAFRPGRPMLIEHVGGIYLEHDLSGQALTAGYGDGYNIVHVREEDPLPPSILTVMKRETVDVNAGNSAAGLPRRNFSDGARAGERGDQLVRPGTARHFAHSRAARAEEAATPHKKTAVPDYV